jgi:dCMP deaminase
MPLETWQALAVYARAMTGPERSFWDEYFMAIARVVATRSTCDRKHVGAVIVGHLMQDGHCVRTVHAEANAIVQAARTGVRIESADIYVTASPCFGCFKLIANAGLSRIVFGEFYRDERIFEVSKALNICVSDNYKRPIPLVYVRRRHVLDSMNIRPGLALVNRSSYCGLVRSSLV